jgi:hypothetical protein|tara:strand:- start:64 stop:300 length:237 start_codon:yes stop_codon:yes gene_type:complete
MENENKFTLKDISIFLDGETLHAIGPDHEEICVSLYELADHLFEPQVIDNPSLIPNVIEGLKNVVEYMEHKLSSRKLQ